MLEVTERASRRIFASENVLDELEPVMTEELGCSRRLAILSRGRIIRRANMVEPGASRHAVLDDVKDTPILRAAPDAGVDYLVTNDRHLLDLDFPRILESEGLIRPEA